jgi:hypothetical protein
LAGTSNIVQFAFVLYQFHSAIFSLQVMYFVYTEVMCKDILDADPELQTSLRWLSTDTKNSTAMAVRAVRYSLDTL